MRARWRAADRAAELLAAARGWRGAGLIDETTIAAIAAAHPCGGPRLGQLWRILVFVCVCVGVVTATVTAFFGFGVREAEGVGLTLLLCGIALAAATDIIVDRCSFQPTGAEAATSLLACGYLGSAVYLFLDGWHWHGREAALVTDAWCAAVFGLAAWRWGFRLYGGVAAVFVLLASATLPSARVSWIVTATLVATAATLVRSKRELTPSHRDGVELIRFVALAAIYGAVNYASLDWGVIEEIGRVAGSARHRAGNGSLLLAGIGSALFPLAVLAWGLRRRERPLIALGILTAALSLATIRWYVHVAPLWAVLAASGAALAATSLLLERWLRSGPAAERGGYTAGALGNDRRREQLLPVAAALSLAPSARSMPEEPTGVDGRGGAFGGGGAGGAY